MFKVTFDGKGFTRNADSRAKHMSTRAIQDFLYELRAKSKLPADVIDISSASRSFDDRKADGWAWQWEVDARVVVIMESDPEKYVELPTDLIEMLYALTGLTPSKQTEQDSPWEIYESEEASYGSQAACEGVHLYGQDPEGGLACEQCGLEYRD